MAKKVKQLHQKTHPTKMSNFISYSRERTQHFKEQPFTTLCTQQHLDLLLVELAADNVSELRQDLVLPLLPLLLAEHGQCSLLVRRVDLVFLTQPDSLHTTVAASAHHIPNVLELGDLVRGQADLTTTRNSLALCNIGCHSCSFTGQQGLEGENRVTKCCVGQKLVLEKKK